MDLGVRKGTEADVAFLTRLHREAMGPHVKAAWGSWDDELQAKHLSKSVPNDHDIVVLDGRAIGCLLVRREPKEVVVSRVWITPSEQGKGIGAQLLTGICEDAAKDDLPVTLRVLKVNPAYRLYGRLGFELTSESETHFNMKYTHPSHREE